MTGLWSRTGRYRVRNGFWGGLILQTQERCCVGSAGWIYRWRDARVTDLKAPSLAHPGVDDASHG